MNVNEADEVPLILYRMQIVFFTSISDGSGWLALDGCLVLGAFGGLLTGWLLCFGIILEAATME